MLYSLLARLHAAAGGSNAAEALASRGLVDGPRRTFAALCVSLLLLACSANGLPEGQGPSKADFCGGCSGCCSAEDLEGGETGTLIAANMPPAEAPPPHMLYLCAMPGKEEGGREEEEGRRAEGSLGSIAFASQNLPATLLAVAALAASG
jgi:hypothetical protein